MKSTKKIIIAILVTIGILAISNNVQAMNVIERPLQITSIIETKLGNGTTVTAPLTPTEQGWWNTLASGGKVLLSRTEVDQNPGLFCIDPDKSIPYSPSVNFSKKEEKTETNNTMAYVLSEPRPDITGQAMYQQTIQGAVWLAKGATDGDHITAAARLLFNKAQVFEQYRNNYQNPSTVKTTPASKEGLSGPYKIKYSMKYFVNTDGTYYFFGNIAKATLKDSNGNAIDGSKWKFTNANGEQITNYGGKYNYPLSEQEFYIKAADASVNGKTTLNIEFNNISATAHTMTIQGWYTRAATEDRTIYCSDCKAKFLANCGDYIGSVKQPGYKVDTVSKTVSCGCCCKGQVSNKYYKIVKDGVGTEQTEGPKCKMTQSIISGNTRVNGKNNYSYSTATVTCGETYYYSYKTIIIGNSGYEGTITEFASVTKHCYGYGTTKQTQYVCSKCTQTVENNQCASCAQGMKGCGKAVGYYVDKDGDVYAGAYCGTSYTGQPQTEKEAQPLMLAYGDRVTTPVTLPIEVEVNWYTKIGGTVWIDGVEGKQEERDGKLTESDKRFSGITVRLYNMETPNTPINQMQTDSNGKYLFETDSQGNKLPSQKTYKVTFEYGGQQYIPVEVTKLSSGNYGVQNSAGEEAVAERNELNAKLFEVVKGTAKNANGGATIPLTYTKDQTKHTSTLIRNQAFYEATKILAYTEEFVGSAAYVEYINLGLVERAQVNLGLMTDAEKVDVSINGKTESYNFAEKSEDGAIDLNIKAADLNKIYNQAIYKSDYNYRISDYNDGNTISVQNASELEVYIIYKIKVKNYSSKTANVTELVNYYPAAYTLKDSWYSKDGVTGKVEWNAAQATSGYNTVYTKSIKDQAIEANKDIYVYLKFQVNKNENGSILLGTEYIVSEITGYSTKEGLIDTNSEPGNIDISNWDNYVKTYEDDTDRAPGLNIHLSEEPRTLKGIVWEDSITRTDSDGVQIGNGTRESAEKVINGVTVQLIELVTLTNGNTYEYIWQEGTTGSNKVSYMDRNGKLHEHEKEVTVEQGEYGFTEILPGTYIVRFIYGDKVTDVTYNGQDYKSTTYVGTGANNSSAKDNKARRLEVMNYSKTITNEIAEVLAGNNKNLLVEKTWMNADTVEKLVVGIKEQSANEISFGLQERPKAKLVATKTATGLKISNKGIVYVDTANGITTGLKQLPNGSYAVELDDELINGAEAEITYSIFVKNNGDKDTLYNYFEGDTLGGQITGNQHSLVTTNASIVYDYPSNIGYDDDATDKWDIVPKATYETKINSAARTALSKKGGVVLSTTALNKALKPGESTEAITIKFSKIMAAGGNDELSYVNNVEIVEVQNQVGRKDKESTPGNYEVGTSNYEPDTGHAKVTVTDPTGQARIYYVLTIVVAAMLITGIVLIKKKVIK